MALDPAALGAATFPTTRKGFDPDAVRRTLASAADELRRLTAELESARAAAAAEPEPLDEARMFALVGEEAGRVLATARQAAEEMRTRGEDESRRALEQATAEAMALRERAEEDVVRQRGEADAEVAALRADAEAEAARVREEAAAEVAGSLQVAREQVEAARREADGIRLAAGDAAAGEVERAKAEGRELVVEAQAVRERILGDLERRRAAAEAQIDVLRRGRVRIQESIDGLRATIDAAAAELETAGNRAEQLVASAPATPAPVTLGELFAEPSWGTEEGAGQLVAGELPDLPPLAPAPTGPAGPAPYDVLTDEPVLLDEPGTDTAGPDAAVPGPLELADPVDDGEAAGDAPAADESAADESAGDAGAVSVSPVVDLTSEERAGDEQALDDLDGSGGPGPGGALDTGAEDVPDAGAPVDALFARIRQSRVEAVARVQEVLDRPVSAAEADADDVDEDGAGEHPDLRPEWLVARDEALDPVERAVLRKVKRVMADEESAALDLLRRQRHVSLEELLGTADEQLGRYREAVAESVWEAASAGAAFSAGRVSGTTALAGPEVVVEMVEELVRELQGPVRTRSEALVADADGTAAELAIPLRSVYREARAQRLEASVLHAVLRAFGWGAHEVLDGDTAVTWEVDPTKSPCPDCEDNALAGSQPAREPFPTLHRHAPAHQGCRCQVVPAAHH